MTNEGIKNVGKAEPLDGHLKLKKPHHMFALQYTLLDFLPLVL